MCLVICIALFGALFWYVSPEAHWLAYILWWIAGICFVAEIVLRIAASCASSNYTSYSGSSYYPSKKPVEPKVCTDYKLRAVEWQKSQEAKKENENG